jgi:hypothetical protein
VVETKEIFLRREMAVFLRHGSHPSGKLSDNTLLAKAFYKPFNTSRGLLGNVLECCSQFSFELDKD